MCLVLPYAQKSARIRHSPRFVTDGEMKALLRGQVCGSAGVAGPRPGMGGIVRVGGIVAAAALTMLLTVPAPTQAVTTNYLGTVSAAGVAVASHQFSVSAPTTLTATLTWLLAADLSLALQRS